MEKEIGSVLIDSGLQSPSTFRPYFDINTGFSFLVLRSGTARLGVDFWLRNDVSQAVNHRDYISNYSTLCAAEFPNIHIM